MSKIDDEAQKIFERMRYITEGDLLGATSRLPQTQDGAAEALSLISAFMRLKVERRIAKELREYQGRGFDCVMHSRYGGLRLPKRPIEILI